MVGDKSPTSKNIRVQQGPVWDPSKDKPTISGIRDPIGSHPASDGLKIKKSPAIRGNRFHEEKVFGAGHSEINTPRIREIEQCKKDHKIRIVKTVTI